MLERLKTWYAEERTKLRAMEPKRRLPYLWLYYKLWIIGIAAFLAVTVFVIVRLSTNVEAYWLNGIFANTTKDASNGSPLWVEFEDYAGFDLHEKKLEFADEYYFDYLKNQARGNSYYNAFVTLADAGVLDFIVMEPDSLVALAQSGRLRDLRLEETAALLEYYAYRLVYFESAAGGQIPVGFDLSDSLLVTKYGLYPEGCALGVAANTKNIEQISLFLEFVLREG